MPNSQKPPKAEERKMDWELTAVSHGSHDDSHDSHDSLARSLSRPLGKSGKPTAQMQDIGNLE